MYIYIHKDTYRCIFLKLFYWNSNSGFWRSPNLSLHEIWLHTVPHAKQFFVPRKCMIVKLWTIFVRCGQSPVCDFVAVLTSSVYRTLPIDTVDMRWLYGFKICIFMCWPGAQKVSYWTVREKFFTINRKKTNRFLFGVSTDKPPSVPVSNTVQCPWLSVLFEIAMVCFSLGNVQ